MVEFNRRLRAGGASRDMEEQKEEEESVFEDETTEEGYVENQEVSCSNPPAIHIICHLSATDRTRVFCKDSYVGVSCSKQWFVRKAALPLFLYAVVQCWRELRFYCDVRETVRMKTFVWVVEKE